MGKFILKRIMNRILHMLAKTLPGRTTIRPFLHKLRGVKIYGKIVIGDDVYIENEYPENVEIHDGAQILLRSTIIAHTRGRGKVIIEKNAYIGANSIIASSSNRTLTIGEGAVVALQSAITSDVPPFTFVSGPRPKPLAQVSNPLTLTTTYEEFIRGLRPIRE